MRARAMLLPALAVAAAGLSPSTSAHTTTSAPGAAAWPAYGRVATAANVATSSLSAADVRLFRRAWSAPVGGMLTAQPLFVPSVAVGRQTVPLLLVASADNSVVALDAMRGTTVWQRSLGPVRPQVCGGSGGIESTPVVDTGTNRVYVIGADGALRALSLSTGRPIAGFDVPIIRRTDVETVWSALRISGNLLYVPVASWCDKGDAAGAWNGRLVAVDLKTGRIAATFDVVKGGENGGGIWGPGGVSVDPRDGTIWTATANAVVHKDGSLDEDAGLAERVVRLTPGLKVLASVAQPDSNPSIAGDQGFGATPMLFQPTGCPPLVAVNSKSAYTYVWKRGALTAPAIVRDKLGPGNGDTFYAEPTWVAPAKTLVVGGASLTNGGAGAVGLHVGPACTFTTRWQADIGGGVQPQPLAVGSVVFVSATATHTLAALDARTGRLIASLNTVTPAYTAPMTAGSLVVVGTANGTVIAFGAPARVSTGSKTR